MFSSQPSAWTDPTLTSAHPFSHHWRSSPKPRRGASGTALIAEGLRILAQDGVDLVFVLGHPGYYPRHGFEPAGRLGLNAPYPIPEIHADAWMVQALRPGLLGTLQGKVVCAQALDSPEHWRE